MTLDERELQARFIESILKEARELKKTSVPTYRDYEHYKEILQRNGLYGYESEIANALGI